MDEDRNRIVEGQGQGQLRRITSRSEIPAGAVILQEQDVLQMQWKRINEWKPRSEVWPMIHGAGILSLSGMLTGAVCNNYFRKKFQLRHYGRLPSYLPTVFIPAMLCYTWHTLLITNNILLGKFDCPLCAQMRSGLLHVAGSAIYPCMVAPPICVVLARKYFTYPLPPLSQHNEVLNMLRSTAFPFKWMLLGIVLWQFAMGAAVAERESRTFYGLLCKGQSNTKDLDRIGGFS